MTFVKGYKPWNKGKTKRNDARIASLSNSDGANLSKFQFEKGHVPWNRGKTGYSTSWRGGKHAEVSKIKISLSRKGKNPWNKGLTIETDSRIKRHTREEIRKSLRKRKMSGLELKVDGIIKKYKLPYKYVGNGKFFIERKNPDFININGEKIAVETYYKRHKDEFRGGCDAWMKDRSDIFRQYGWSIIFLEGSNITNDFVFRELKQEGGGK